jgi:outer membrane protein assembly factor BamB
MSFSKVFLGVHGDVVALDRTTGQELWHTKLAGGDFVNLLLDQDRILATTKGKAFCLDAATGQILWRNDLPGLGLGLVSIATASGSTPFGPSSEKRRQDVAATTAAIAASS